MSERRLPVRSCRVLGADDASETHHTVECPRRQLSTSFAQCCGCSHKLSIEVEEDGKHGTVTCDVAEEKVTRARVDVAEAAVRVRVGELVGLDTTCVASNLPATAISDLLASGKLRAVPVVDERRRLVGIVSKSDLLRPGRRRAAKTAADLMTPLVHGLPEDAPVAYAISLMAFEDLLEVPIVDKDARVIGMLTATDALRWVARSLGYVVPSDRSPHSR